MLQLIVSFACRREASLHKLCHWQTAKLYLGLPSRLSLSHDYLRLNGLCSMCGIRSINDGALVGGRRSRSSGRRPVTTQITLSNYSMVCRALCEVGKTNLESHSSYIEAKRKKTLMVKRFLLE